MKSHKDQRQLYDWAIKKPLFPNHMSFIVGPRQVGKTTLAQTWLAEKKLASSNYLNFDLESVRKKFSVDVNLIDSLKRGSQKTPIVLDEIHKMRNWKRSLKGIYDVFKDDFNFVVTGSGRLDAFQRGGDSLAGRYDIYQLFPFTPSELDGVNVPLSLNLDELFSRKSAQISTCNDWLNLGGFPEPFFMGSRNKMLRWWQQYTIRVSEEDMRDLTALQSVDLMKNLIEILPSRVASPLSINSLREDLDTSFETAKRYVRNLNQLYLCFELPAYHYKIHRSIKKEKKLYFYNHAIIEDEGARLENAVAICLKKWISMLNEMAVSNYELYYLRDQDRREVDFLITENKKPILLFEVKSSDLKPTTAGLYYAKKLKIPFIQIVGIPNVKRKTDFGGILSVEFLF